jgi:predicted CoA-substrate-specific enzyme activase
MGIDIGSTASKCIVLKDGKEIAAKAMIPFGAGTSGPSRARAEVLAQAGITEHDLAFMLATGYGRNVVEGAGDQMSELSCHARGAYFLFPDVHTVIDIGGQDAKVLRLGKNGILENFVMNDKCAAGTGRFLDVMARVLEVDINDMETLSAQSQHKVNISSTCTVFAESEVISQLSGNTDKCDIINGIHRAVAGRTSGLAKRLGVIPQVVMTGGVAKNQGVVRALSEELQAEIFISPLAQYNGALGAALFAWQKYQKSQLAKEGA